MSTGTSLRPLAPYTEGLLLWDQPFGEPVYQIPQSVAAGVILTDCGPLLQAWALNLSLLLCKQPLTLPYLYSPGRTFA